MPRCCRDKLEFHCNMGTVPHIKIQLSTLHEMLRFLYFFPNDSYLRVNASPLFVEKIMLAGE